MSTETEINFYRTGEVLMSSIGPLLIKALGEQKRVLFFCNNEEKIRTFDDSLWTYGRTKFIPHATILDQSFDWARQPILLTNLEQNTNQAEYLLFLDQPNQDFVFSFQRVFHFFELETSSNIKPNNFYVKQDGKWIKQ